MVLPVFAGRRRLNFAVRCCGFALSGRLSVAACAPPAVSASARLPMHAEYRIDFIFFPPCFHFSVSILDKIDEPIIQHR
jgi:hypothetical protein